MVSSGYHGQSHVFFPVRSNASNIVTHMFATALINLWHFYITLYFIYLVRRNWFWNYLI
jgi:hypothetical protein